MSAVELKTSVKTQFDLKELKCLKPESSTLSGGTVKTATPSGRPMGDLENNRDPQRFNMDEDKSKLTKMDKFSYPVHRKRSRYLSQSRTTDNHHNKKRRKGIEKIILPTKFLLGGNINDPLNLNSLCDEEVNRALNERTPQSSPIPTPAHRRDVTLIMPRNQFDPLNLNEPDMENEPLTPAKICAKRKKRHKNRKKNDPNIENTGAPTTPLITKESEKKKHLAEALKIEIDDTASTTVVPSVKGPPQDKPKTPQVPTSLSMSGTLLSMTGGSTTNSEVADTPKVKPENKIVSPVIPQLSPKNRKRRQTSICEGRSSEQNPVSSKNINRSESCPGEINKTAYPRKNRRRHSNRGSGNKKGQVAKSKSYRFIYGNYNRYYGYRNPDEHDSRTNAFKLEWFEGKKVLDIGCNVGHLTLFVARDFKPLMILGLDIDGRLISAARKNIRHYLIQDDQNKYPNSCKLSYGPLAAPVRQEARHTVFPHNVTFAQGSYVLESDELLELQKPEYDLILCMSLTKWIHLNWGDAGLKRSFKRMYRQLKPGGKLIFEPQSWSSYKKRKGLTETIYNNFCNIKLKPENFADYLTSPEVGFSKYEIIGVPVNKSKGFQRPIYLFCKDEDDPMTMNESSQGLNSHITTELVPPPCSDNPPLDWSASQTSHFPVSAAVSLSSSSKDTTDSAFLNVPTSHQNTEQPKQTVMDSSQERGDSSLAGCQKVAHSNANTKESTLGLSETLTALPPPSTLPPPPPPSSSDASSSLAINPSLSSSSSVTMETEASTPTAETTQSSKDN